MAADKSMAAGSPYHVPIVDRVSWEGSGYGVGACGDSPGSHFGTSERCTMPHIVMTVSGTGVDMWNTAPPQPAGVAAALAAASPDLFYWQPVGNYPASVFPMGPSVNAGVAELNRLCTQINPPGGAPSYPENSIILLGYSQGAIVVCQFLHTIASLNPPTANRIVAMK